jgi:hypothetical protein
MNSNDAPAQAAEPDRERDSAKPLPRLHESSIGSV